MKEAKEQKQLNKALPVSATVKCTEPVGTEKQRSNLTGRQ